MKNNILLRYSTLKIFTIAFSLILILGLIPFFIFETHPFILLANIFINFYLTLAENIANSILQASNSNVIIVNHTIVFQNITDYVSDNKQIIDNWTNYVLFKKWSAFILLLIWITQSSIKKKLIYTGGLLFTHFISLLSGILIITFLGPIFVVSDSLTQLKPNSFGALAMITLLVIWIKNNLPEIQTTLSKIRINLTYSKKVINEIIVLFFIYSLLKNFIIPYFNFYYYINFLLNATNGIVSLMDYDATIKGPYLIGNSGTLYMAKWCLGFLTMFTFASLVYLTSNKTKTKWIYIFSGIAFLHIVNIIRLAALFIFVQNNNSTQMANDHHAIYNIIVYIIIFILWVIWFEKLADIKPTIKKG